MKVDMCRGSAWFSGKTFQVEENVVGRTLIMYGSLSEAMGGILELISCVCKITIVADAYCFKATFKCPALCFVVVTSCKVCQPPNLRPRFFNP